MTIHRLPNQELPRNFKDWPSLLVREVFGLHPNPKLERFQDWSSSRHPVPEAYAYWMERFRLELQDYHESWNEVELMMNFIGPFIKLISFGGRHYGMFFNRKIQVVFQELRLSGTTDGVVSFGYHEPIQPYFFLKEYKKSQGYDNEPFGQLLISMVAAQQLNNDGQPLYGCYVIGKIWTFVLLDGQQYATTQSYDATDAGELQIIWSMLVEVKRIVEERVERLLAQAE